MRKCNATYIRLIIIYLFKFRPRGVKIPILRVTTTQSPPLSSEGDEDEKPDIPAEVKRPSLSGRKVVLNRVTPRIVENTTPTSIEILTSSTGRPRVISKTRIESMGVPRPVSFSKKSKTSAPKQPAAEEQPNEEVTTLEPIPVPSFEPTRARKPSQNPIIQSITIDNEEDSSSDAAEQPQTQRPPLRKVV